MMIFWLLKVLSGLSLNRAINNEIIQRNIIGLCLNFEQPLRNAAPVLVPTAYFV